MYSFLQLSFVLVSICTQSGGHIYVSLTTTGVTGVVDGSYWRPYFACKSNKWVVAGIVRSVTHILRVTHILHVCCCACCMDYSAITNCMILYGSSSLRLKNYTLGPDIVSVWYFAYSHYNDVILSAKTPQITSLTIVCSTVYSGADQRKHQSSASLAFVRVNSRHKGPVTQKMFPLDDVIMVISLAPIHYLNQCSIIGVYIIQIYWAVVFIRDFWTTRVKLFA